MAEQACMAECAETAGPARRQQHLSHSQGCLVECASHKA